MANTSSAKKAIRQAARRTTANVRFKSSLRASLKSASPATISATISLIDKAAKRHLMHPNRAARLKSQLMRTHGAPTTKRPGAGGVVPKPAETKKPSATKSKATTPKPAKAATRKRIPKK
ncbi:30S ribosomal protein S20 [Candidatus Berkelbacteria bacterium]|nr:30S ribosomal protein S20 [Candidatus Berkelbacteria bacterium]